MHARALAMFTPLSKGSERAQDNLWGPYPVTSLYLAELIQSDQTKSPRRPKVRASLQVTPQKATATTTAALGHGVPSVVQRTEVQPISAARAARHHRRHSLAEVDDSKDVWTRWLFRVCQAVAREEKG